MKYLTTPMAICGLLAASPCVAQTTITLSDKQIESIVQAGAACLEKVPYACARYAIYIQDLLMPVKQEKPEPKKE